MKKKPARFAPVAPLPLLVDLWHANEGTHSQHGSYHLLLAHDVLKDEQHMKAWGLHTQQVREFFGEETLIIMDNSIVELGDAVDMHVVAQAGAITGADILVLPDVMGKGPESIKATEKAVLNWMKAPSGSFDLMAVPQGPSIGEFADCLETFNQWEEITWIGVPRIATQQLGTRRNLIDLCRAINPQWSLHLLGFSDNVVDDILCASMGHVEGIDSAVPVRAGQNGTPFRLAQSDYGKRGNYWDGYNKLNVQTCENIEYVRQLIGEQY